MDKVTYYTNWCALTDNGHYGHALQTSILELRLSYFSVPLAGGASAALDGEVVCLVTGDGWGYKIPLAGQNENEIIDALFPILQ